jgi:hypothetical protein
MDLGNFYGGMFLVFAALSHLAIQGWRSRGLVRSEVLISRRQPLNRKDQSGA